MIGLFITFYLAGQFTAASKAANIMEMNPTTVAVALSKEGGLGGLFASLSSLGPSLYLGLYWKKCTSQGILAGVLTGIPATCVWYYLFKASTGIHEAVSVAVPILAAVLVSLMTQNVKQEENWAAELGKQESRAL